MKRTGYGVGLALDIQIPTIPTRGYGTQGDFVEALSRLAPSTRFGVDVVSFAVRVFLEASGHDLAVFEHDVYRLARELLPIGVYLVVRPGRIEPVKDIERLRAAGFEVTLADAVRYERDGWPGRWVDAETGEVTRAIVPTTITGTIRV